MPPDEFDRPHDRLFRYAFERPEIAEGELRALLAAAPAELFEAYPVGNRVNSVKNDDAECLERVVET